MRDQEIIRRLKVHSKMIEALALQQKQLEQYIGVTMEVVKAMDDYPSAELRVKEQLKKSKK